MQVLKKNSNLHGQIKCQVDLISSLKNFKHIKWCYGKNYLKNMRVLGQKSFSKLPMNADKTDLKAACLAISRKTLCITFEVAIQ